MSSSETKDGEEEEVVCWLCDRGSSTPNEGGLGVEDGSLTNESEEDALPEQADGEGDPGLASLRCSCRRVCRLLRAGVALPLPFPLTCSTDCSGGCSVSLSGPSGRSSTWWELDMRGRRTRMGPLGGAARGGKWFEMG